MFRFINNINYLFVFALIIGVLLVSQELFQSKSSNQYLRQQNAVALVNDMTISEDQYIKYISTLGIDVVDENDEELLPPLTDDDSDCGDEHNNEPVYLSATSEEELPRENLPSENKIREEKSNS